MKVTDGELRALTRLTARDAESMFEAGDHYRHRRFVELYRIVAQRGLIIPLEQLQFCFSRDPNGRAGYD